MPSTVEGPDGLVTVVMENEEVWSITTTPDRVTIYDAAGECRFDGRPHRLSAHLAIAMFEWGRLQAELQSTPGDGADADTTPS